MKRARAKWPCVLHVVGGGFHEGVEEAAGPALLTPQLLRVALYGHEEAVVMAFHALDDTVWCPCRGDQPRRYLIYGLVVGGVAMVFVGLGWIGFLLIGGAVGAVVGCNDRRSLFLLGDASEHAASTLNAQSIGNTCSLVHILATGSGRSLAAFWSADDLVVDPTRKNAAAERL